MTFQSDNCPSLCVIKSSSRKKNHSFFMPCITFWGYPQFWVSFSWAWYLRHVRKEFHYISQKLPLEVGPIRVWLSRVTVSSPCFWAVAQKFHTKRLTGCLNGWNNEVITFFIQKVKGQLHCNIKLFWTKKQQQQQQQFSGHNWTQ